MNALANEIQSNLWMCFVRPNASGAPNVAPRIMWRCSQLCVLQIVDASSATCVRTVCAQILSNVFHFPYEWTLCSPDFDTVSYRLFLRFQLRKLLQILYETVRAHNQIHSNSINTFNLHSSFKIIPLANRGSRW